MEFDPDFNFIVLRMKNSEVFLIQLIENRIDKYHITEKIEFKSYSD